MAAIHQFLLCIVSYFYVCNAYTCSTVDDRPKQESLPLHHDPNSAALNLHTKDIWPDAHVIYNLSNSLRESDIVQVYNAFSEYQSKTCVRFVPLNNLFGKAYTSIEMNPALECGGVASLCMNGGYQYTRVGNGGRNPNCVLGSIWVHELGHTLCLDHEHQRADRDQYVDINLDGQTCKESELKKLSENSTARGIYDYASQMHYPCGKCVIAKNGIVKNFCGHQVTKGLSLLDVDHINNLYFCGSCFRHRWVPIEQLNHSTVPNTQISPCRALFDSEMEIVVGTFHPLDKSCYVAFNGEEKKLTRKGFEVLIIPLGWENEESEYYWEEAHTDMKNYELDLLFANAIPGGQMAWNRRTGMPIGYIGYATLEYKKECGMGPARVDLIGMVWRYHDGLRSFFPMILCNKVNEPKKVKVLVCKSKMRKQAYELYDRFLDSQKLSIDFYKSWRQRYMKQVEFEANKQLIMIQGHILPNASEIYFDITTQPAGGTIPLHIFFSLEPNSTVSVKSLSKKGWTPLHSEGVTSRYWFARGNNYKLQIEYVVKPNVGFIVYLNEAPLVEVPIKERLSTVFLRIHGDTFINLVNLPDTKRPTKEKESRPLETNMLDDNNEQSNEVRFINIESSEEDITYSNDLTPSDKNRDRESPHFISLFNGLTLAASSESVLFYKVMLIGFGVLVILVITALLIGLLRYRNLYKSARHRACYNAYESISLTSR